MTKQFLQKGKGLKDYAKCRDICDKDDFSCSSEGVRKSGEDFEECLERNNLLCKEECLSKEEKKQKKWYTTEKRFEEKKKELADVGQQIIKERERREKTRKQQKEKATQGIDLPTFNL